MSAGDLYALAEAYLTAVDEAVTASPGGTISRTLISPGPPTFDCEMIAIWAGGPVEAATAPLSPPLQPGKRSVDQGLVNLVALTAVVLRCVPPPHADGSPPSAVAISAAAENTYGDVWSVWNHVRTRYIDGTLFTRSDGEPRELFFDPAIPVNSSGGIGGWQVPIRTQLDGYRT